MNLNVWRLEVPRWLRRHALLSHHSSSMVPPHEIHPPIDKTTLKPTSSTNDLNQKSTTENLKSLFKPSGLLIVLSIYDKNEETKVYFPYLGAPLDKVCQQNDALPVCSGSG